MQRKTLKERFESKVVKVASGCHEWAGCTMKNGYGQINVDRRAAYAHRVSYELYKGQIVGGLYVLHKCDNRKCVNPDHLFLGTFHDNMDDMVRKGRHAAGDKSGRRKLCSDQVRKIREMSGTHGEIGMAFGVTRSLVSMIRSGRIWKSI